MVCPHPDRPAWTPPQPARPASGICGLWGLPRVVLHRVTTPRWTAPPLRIAVLADPHVCRPWVAPERMARIVVQVQGLGADVILIAGDFLPDRKMPCRHLPPADILPLFAGMAAPLGVWTVLGNHDYGDDPLARRTRWRESAVKQQMAASGIRHLSNAAVPLDHRGTTVWLVGLDSQRDPGTDVAGRADPETAFAAVPDGAPSVLLAHQPDVFAAGDPRPALQVSGHTHGGQFVLFGRRPMTPSEFGDRYAIGHIAEAGRHLVVSAGLGYSGLPLRFGVPPELTCIELGGPTGAPVKED